MPRKSKKVQEAANQADNQIEVGNQTIEVGNEVVPSTIVEGSEVEVFGSTQEGTTEVAPVETPIVQAVEQIAQAAPKPPRVSKRPYIARVCELLEAGTHDAKEIVALVLVEFPEVKKGGIQTFVTDLKNPKYRHWKDRAVVVNGSGKLQFEDTVVKVEAEPAPEAPVEVVPEVVATTEELQAEQPNE